MLGVDMAELIHHVRVESRDINDNHVGEGEVTGELVVDLPTLGFKIDPDDRQSFAFEYLLDNIGEEFLGGHASGANSAGPSGRFVQHPARRRHPQILPIALRPAVHDERHSTRLPRRPDNGDRRVRPDVCE